MSKFYDAIPTVFTNEGIDDGIDSDDPGGLTRFGITLEFLREDGIFGDLNGDGFVDLADIRLMTRDKAYDAYERVLWKRWNYGEITSQKIATKILDCSVPMGPRQSHLIVQRALRAIGNRVKEDGILGPRTIRAINASSEDALLIALRSEIAGVYRMITFNRKVKGCANPDKYLAGWLNRAYQ